MKDVYNSFILIMILLNIMTNQLIFIGVLHGDNRVKKILKKIKPDLITIEMSEVYWNILVKNHLEESYGEVCASIDYAKKTNTLLYFIDKSQNDKILKNRMDQSRSKSYSREEIGEIYSFFKKHYKHRSKETENILIYGQREHKDRTMYMAEKLKQLLKNNIETKIVHIGGAGHFLNTKKIITLFSLLKKYKPKRYLVTDFFE